MRHPAPHSRTAHAWLAFACLVAAAVTAVQLCTGCAAWRAHGGPEAVDCAVGKLEQDAALIVPTVLAILSGESWEEGLAKLAVKVGSDVVACAVQHVHLHTPMLRSRTGKYARVRRVTYRGLP